MMDHSNRKATIFASRGTKDEIENIKKSLKTIDEDNLYSNLVNYCEIYKEKINPEKEAKIIFQNH